MLAKEYFERIDSILRKVEEKQARKLTAAAGMIVDGVLSGGRFLIYDKGGAISSEVTGRAGGLTMAQPVGDASLLRGNDTVVVSSVKNNDPSDASFVEKAKANGAKTIAILPFSNPPDASGNLQGKVDVAVDDYAEPGDGCLRVRGYASKICPTTGVTNAAIVWAVCAEVVGELNRRGKEAHIYKSMFRVGSNEWNAKMSEEFKKTGY